MIKNVLDLIEKAKAAEMKEKMAADGTEHEALQPEEELDGTLPADSALEDAITTGGGTSVRLSGVFKSISIAVTYWTLSWCTPPSRNKARH